MAPRKDEPMPHVEVPDGAAAFRKLEAFTRRVLSVPKKDVDAVLAKERAGKRKRKMR